MENLESKLLRRLLRTLEDAFDSTMDLGVGLAAISILGINNIYQSAKKIIYDSLDIKYNNFSKAGFLEYSRMKK